METGSKRITDRSINCFLPHTHTHIHTCTHTQLGWLYVVCSPRRRQGDLWLHTHTQHTHTRTEMSVAKRCQLLFPFSWTSPSCPCCCCAALLVVCLDCVCLFGVCACVWHISCAEILQICLITGVAVEEELMLIFIISCSAKQTEQRACSSWGGLGEKLVEPSPSQAGQSGHWS